MEEHAQLYMYKLYTNMYLSTYSGANGVLFIEKSTRLLRIEPHLV